MPQWLHCWPRSAQVKKSMTTSRMMSTADWLCLMTAGKVLHTDCTTNSPLLTSSAQLQSTLSPVNTPGSLFILHYAYSPYSCRQGKAHSSYSGAQSSRAHLGQLHEALVECRQLSGHLRLPALLTAHDILQRTDLWPTEGVWPRSVDCR